MARHAKTIFTRARGKEVMVYAPDHKHYRGYVNTTRIHGRCVVVHIPPNGGPGTYAGGTHSFSTGRVTLL